MKQPLGVILAGGLARRMGGGDKGRLLLGRRSMIARVVERLAPQVAEVGLNANGNPDRFKDLGLPVFSDSIDDYAGPLAGVLAGLDWAHELGGDHIVTVAADTPFFPCDLVPQLILASEGMDMPLALAATKDEEGRLYRQPTFGLWPVALREDLRKHLGNGLRKIVQWTELHQGREAIFSSMPIDPFFNINTPQDLEIAEALLEEKA